MIDFGVVFFYFTAPTDSQRWTLTSSTTCVHATKPEVWRKKTHGENVSNDPGRPADAGDKRPQWGLAESVSDNCSITRPVGRLVWRKRLSKRCQLKKCIKLEAVYDECDCLAESGQ